VCAVLQDDRIYFFHWSTLTQNIPQQKEYTFKQDMLCIKFNGLNKNDMTTLRQIIQNSLIFSGEIYVLISFLQFKISRADILPNYT
jgi:hypothetical protein